MIVFHSSNSKPHKSFGWNVRSAKKHPSDTAGSTRFVCTYFSSKPQKKTRATDQHRAHWERFGAIGNPTPFTDNTTVAWPCTTATKIPSRKWMFPSRNIILRGLVACWLFLCMFVFVRFIAPLHPRWVYHIDLRWTVLCLPVSFSVRHWTHIPRHVCVYVCGVNWIVTKLCALSLAPRCCCTLTIQQSAGKLHPGASSLSARSSASAHRVAQPTGGSTLEQQESKR